MKRNRDFRNHDLQFSATSLHRACERGCDVEEVKHLLTADTRVLNWRSRSPLHSAARGRCSVQVFRLLARFKEYINHRDHWGKTPLFYASVNNCEKDVIRELIHLGADVVTPDPQGYSPIETALDNFFDVEVVKILVKAGAKIDIPNRDGAVPLHKILSMNCNITFPPYVEKLIPVLLNPPSLIQLKNNAGVSPYDLVMPMNFHRKEIIRWSVFQDYEYAVANIKEDDLDYYLDQCLRDVQEIHQFDKLHNCALHLAIKNYFILPSTEWEDGLDSVRDVILTFNQPSLYSSEIAAVQEALIVLRTYYLRIYRNSSCPVALDILSSNRIVDFLTREDRFHLAVAFNPDLLERSLLSSIKIRNL